MSTGKDATKDKILMSLFLKKIFKIWEIFFELIQIEAECSKNYFKISLSKEAGASENNIEKESQNPRPKLEKYEH